MPDKIYSPTGHWKSAIYRIELIAATGTIFVALAIGLGFPAIYFQMNDLGVPSHLISFHRSLYAGAIPAGCLVLVGLYCFWLINNTARKSARIRKRRYWYLISQFGIVGISFAAALGSTFLLGGLSTIFIVFWFFSQLLIWLTSLIVPMTPSHTQIFNVAITLMIVAFFGFAALMYWPTQGRDQVAKRPTKHAMSKTPRKTQTGSSNFQSVDWGLVFFLVSVPILCAASLSAAHVAMESYL
ncbi:MAG TPA: hypothetical protein VGA00_05155 [Acidiferrobacterales bacterium]|jgi:hypothetical protein